MFKKSIINRFLAAAAALTTAAALVLLPGASFVSHAEEEDTEIEEAIAEEEEAADLEDILTEETVRTMYADENGELIGIGTAVIIYDNASGEILQTQYYDEDGKLLFKAEIDPEAEIRLYAKNNGRPAVLKVELGTLIEDDLTAEELAGQVVEAMADVESIAYSSLTDLNCTIGAQGMSMDLGMQIGIEMEAVDDPVSSHMIMDYSMQMMGEEMSEQMEVYVVGGEDENTLIIYTRMIADGEASDWEMEETDYNTPSESNLYNSSVFEKIRDGEIESLLGTSTVFVDDIECYVLDATLTGETLQEVSGYMMSGGQEDAGLFDTEDVDFGEVEADMTAFISVEDNTLVAMQLDCLPLAQVLLAESMGLSEEEVELDIRNFDMLMRYREYNIDPIEIPDFE